MIHYFAKLIWNTNYHCMYIIGTPEERCSTTGARLLPISAMNMSSPQGIGKKAKSGLLGRRLSIQCLTVSG